MRRRDVAMRVARRMLRRLQAAVFDAWYENVQLAVEAREDKLRHAYIMMHLRVVQLCFRAWAQTCAGDAARRETGMRRVLGLMRSRIATLCMRAWVDMYREQQALKAKAASRWANQGLVAGFQTWATKAAEQKKLRARLRAIAIRMSRRLEVVVLQVGANPPAHAFTPPRMPGNEHAITPRGAAVAHGLCSATRARRTMRPAAPSSPVSPPARAPPCAVGVVHVRQGGTRLPASCFRPLDQ